MAFMLETKRLLIRPVKVSDLESVYAYRNDPLVARYQGCIDIEGWHDPVYRDALEITGQEHGLNYLKRCRGGPFVPNPA